MAFFLNGLLNWVEVEFGWRGTAKGVAFGPSSLHRSFGSGFFNVAAPSTITNNRLFVSCTKNSLFVIGLQNSGLRNRLISST
jgi:hypothetical protein